MIEERLSFRNFSKTYYVAGFAPIVAIQSVTIENMEPGEIICLMGQNGSGKTTLLDAILGIFPNKSGDVVIEGQVGNVINNRLKYAYVPQRPHEGLAFDMSIIDNVALKAVFHSGVNLRKAVTKRVRDEIEIFIDQCDFEFLLDKLEMPPVALSGGEQQIVNIIGAIISEPDIIICDEPTSKLDEQNRIRVSNLLLKAAHEKDVRILCSTHDQELADRIGDRIMVLNKGTIEREKSLREPHSNRWIGDIRSCKTKNDLPIEFENMPEKWWLPTDNALFDDDYFNGDDSYVGYLANNPLERSERTIREVKGALRLAKLDGREEDFTIADIPCGWGRHSIELAKKGYKVKSVDLSSKYLNLLAENIKDNKLENIQIYECDMRSLIIEKESCDLIVNMWTSFGFFTDEQNCNVLRQFKEALKPNGKIIIHTDLNPERIRLGIFDEPPRRDLKNGGILLVKEYYCEEDHCVYGTWQTGEQGNVHTYKMRIYSVRAWEEMAKDLGLQIEGIHGGFDERDGSLNDRSQEFVIVLKKKSK